MTHQYRSAFLAVVLVILAGCSRGQFGGYAQQIEPITDTEMVRMLQHFDGTDAGDLYTLSMSVPESWVGQFETRTEGNKIVFNYLRESGSRAPIFTIEALSEAQYWKQIGSYPETHINLSNLDSTYFVYSVPKDAFYSGLTTDQFDAFAEQVRQAVTTFRVEAVDDPALMRRN